MRHFKTTIDIPAPAQRVWEVISDVARWHEWTPSITSIERRDDGPFGVGSRARVRQPKFPAAFWKVTSFEPGTGFDWVSAGPGFRAVGGHWIEPTETGSRATLSVDFEGILGGVWGRMTGGITQRYIDWEARGLKARSEDPEYRHEGPGA
jgi:ribosome-associated toxin RatA of RatAB toxin-antitoxin module